MQLVLRSCTDILFYGCEAPPSDIHSRQRTIKRLVEGNFGGQNVRVGEHHQLHISLDAKEAIVCVHKVRQRRWRF